MNDIVVRRLFSAGLALEAVAGLMGDHRAAGKVQKAISELDLAVRDLRDMVFDRQSAEEKTLGRRASGTVVAATGQHLPPQGSRSHTGR